jgi:cyanate permease
MSMPVLFKEISEDLGLNLVQIGAIWGIGSLTGILTGLIGGSLGDRFGIKLTLSIACFLGGISGALRGFSDGFYSLAGTILLTGFLIPVIPMNVHKTCGIWFSGRRLGFANGVVSTGMALGFMLGSLVSATFLSPWLGGWRNVLFFYGAISMLISIPWMFIRSGPRVVEKSFVRTVTHSFRQVLIRLLSIKNIWILGFAILGVGGCIQGTLGYIPLYLREIRWSGAAADSALSAFHGISMLFAIPITMLSDKYKPRKKILMIASLLIIIGVGSLTVVQGPVIWISVLIAGMVRDGFMALFMTVIIETGGVGANYAGTAIGLVMVFLNIGSILLPPLGNSLASIDLSLPFLLWSGFAALGLISLNFVRENKV